MSVKNVRWVVTMFLLLGLYGGGRWTAGAENPPPTAPQAVIPVCGDAPVIDGALTDACWQTAYQSPCFYDFELKQEKYTRNEDTQLYLTTDGQWLYVGVACRHPNPQDMKVTVQENFGGRLFGDECIKFFINPGIEGGGNLRYVLSSANICTLSSSFSTDTPNLAWPSATRLTDTGWEAEVAVPLFYMAGYGRLEDFRMNVFRNKVIKEYDAYDVEVGFHDSISCWSPTGEWLNYDEFARVEGLAKLKPVFPLVVNAGEVSVGGIYEEDGATRFDVDLTLKAMTAQGGDVSVEVIERPLAGIPQTTRKTFAIAAGAIKRVKVPVSVTTLGDRKMDVVIRGVQNGMPFQTIQVNTEGFELLSGLTRFNYYTGETHAEILYTVGMSRSALTQARIAVLDDSGAELAVLDAPEPRGTLALPLEKLANGTHVLQLGLQNAQGNAICELPFELVKLPPKPGCEWKIDRGTGGSLLRDGVPYFPFGMLVHDREDAFRTVAEMGMNSAVWWTSRDFRDQPGPESFATVAQRAAQHGLTLMVRPEKIASVSADMPVLNKYFPEPKAFETAAAWLKSLGRLKGLHEGPCGKFSRTQRNEIAMEWMDFHLPLILENVRAVRDLPQIIGYKTMDEPLFTSCDIDRPLRKMYLEVKDADPYRPMFLLYSSIIPPDPVATSFADCLGTDPYWTPGKPLPRGSINWMSVVTAKTVARAQKEGLMPWTMPETSLWSHTIKRMITPEEQICQTYLALIHGTRGIWYFTLGWMVHAEQRAAFTLLSERVKTLSPALTASRPDQKISYTPGVWAPLKDELPDVQASLLRFPDGRYVLLAANVRRSPVRIAVRVAGAADGALKDLFAGEIAAVQDGAFTDTLSARGVRSYLFDNLAGDGPVSIAINITPLGDAGDVEPGFRSVGRSGQKNILPNPSFEETTHPDWPDYYWPLFDRGNLAGWSTLIGDPDAPLGIVTENPYHGERCVYITQWHHLRFRISPQHPAQQPYVFSFYARTDSAKPVRIRNQPGGWLLDRNARTVEIKGSEWQRYVFRMQAPPKMDHYASIILILESPGNVYFDALQLEKGIEPTEFQP